MIFLQNLLRGRAAQVALYETRDRLRALVGELQFATRPNGEHFQGTLEPSQGVGDNSRAALEPANGGGDLPPGPSELSGQLPPAAFSLEAFKEKGLGEVLGDMLGALSIADVALRRAKLLEIETRHGKDERYK